MNGPLGWRYQQHCQPEQAKPLLLSPYFTPLRCPAAWANDARPSGRAGCWRTAFLAKGLGCRFRRRRKFLGELGVWGAA